ncbi:methanogen output domain 1-containing protein [Methanolobus sp. ZRKC3]|uniref:methanogen output domain 1-containing protein n=1 Tax=Methanolobus sp. ZRKC3 TaxID=3125786 RepID=UPI00324ADCE1
MIEGAVNISDDQRPTILIVDDEAMNIELLRAYLDETYDVISATSGKKALELIEDDLPDIILLDVMMPEMNGYEVCEVLKKNPETQFIPIIMVTALSGRNDWIAGIEAGADEFLTKPVNKLELMTRINSLLRLKKLHSDLLAERDKLNLQNRIRSVLTQIIPSLLRTLSPEQKNIVIHQMIDMVVDALLKDTNPEDSMMKYECVGDLCCQVINQLGAQFDVESSEEGNKSISGNHCPWGKEEAQSNPILCTLTRGIFSRIISMSGEDVEIDVIETMGNGDECCLFEIIDLD